MKATAMLDNIVGQPQSLRAVSEYWFGEGSEALRLAAHAVRGAGQVVFAGMGSSLYASMAAAACLQSHGFSARAIDASELLHFGGATPCPGAAVVLVSRSGETVEVTKLLAGMEHRDAVIGVTNSRDSQLAGATRFPLFVNSASDRMVAVQTYTGTMAALLLLAAAVLEIPRAESRRALDQAIAALAASIDHELPAKPEWIEFLTGAEVVYFLGRGPSLASVHEGALLFHEAARTPAIAMSAAGFRHGPVEVVDRRFRAIVFASQPVTRHLDVALAHDLQAMGGGVHICETTGSPHFAPLSEIVPVQLAACWLALEKGLDPGDFRHATLITRTEAGFDKP